MRVFDYGTAGVGSTGHFTMELLKLRLGFFAVHIPYRGGGMQGRRCSAARSL